MQHNGWTDGWARRKQCLVSIGGVHVVVCAYSECKGKIYDGYCAVSFGFSTRMEMNMLMCELHKHAECHEQIKPATLIKLCYPKKTDKFNHYQRTLNF